MKKTLKILGLVICLVLLFKGWIYRWAVTYQEIGQRQVIALQDSGVVADMQKKRNQRALSVEEIVEISRSETSARLRYTTGKASSNPNVAARSGAANCVGYSALFGSMVNQLSLEQRSSHSLRARHLIGRLYFLGVDMHQFFSSPFFRDHDFVEIEDVTTGEKIFVDPVVSDYLGIDRVTRKR
ncbi:MAG: hypothetical protein JNJ90_21355 [Saprospiraceae bacterium]|nr:hypothetical protein [Saprospiraceae bacterium]